MRFCDALRRAWCLFPALAMCGPVPASGAQVVSTQEHSFRVVKLTQGLEHPWSVAFLPDGRLLVTERPGRLRIVRADGRLEQHPVSGLPKIAEYGQGGLLDVALHPRYAQNRLVYLSFAARGPGGVSTEVGRGPALVDRDGALDFTSSYAPQLSFVARRAGTHRIRIRSYSSDQCPSYQMTVALGALDDEALRPPPTPQDLDP